MRINILALFFTVTSILVSCNSEQEKQGYSNENEDMVTMDNTVLSEPPPMADEVEASSLERKETSDSKTEISANKVALSKKKIIKDGNISVKTSDIHSSKKGIDGLLKKLNGYYESENLQNNDRTVSYDLKVRVPADKFELLIASIENGNDEIKSKDIKARDVTAEYIDIETRLANKREYLNRYKELLSKASTVKDILEIEENIRVLQEEIESKEGQLKYLSDQVSFSTLDVNLFKEKEFVYKPQPQDRFSERVKTSINNGWSSVVNFILWIVTIWPVIILTFIAFFAIMRVIKKRSSKQ